MFGKITAFVSHEIHKYIIRVN